MTPIPPVIPCGSNDNVVALPGRGGEPRPRPPPVDPEELEGIANWPALAPVSTPSSRAIRRSTPTLRGRRTAGLR
jgi:hypothetical protein